MKKLQAKVDFSKFRDAVLETLGHSIIVHMTGNEHFPELADDVALVQSAHVAYVQALSEASDGGKHARAKKDEKRAALRHALRGVGVKINLKARGDEAALTSTGYPLGCYGTGGKRKAAAVKTDPLSKAGAISFTLFQGTGSVEAAVAPVDGAVAYFWQYAPCPAAEGSQWITMVTTRNVFLFTGLTIGQQYCFKVAGIGYDPTLNFSDVGVSFAV